MVFEIQISSTKGSIFIDLDKIRLDEILICWDLQIMKDNTISENQDVNEVEVE